MTYFQPVRNMEHVAFKQQRGCIPETHVWRLELACGHFQIRTDHNCDVKKAKCKECADEKGER